MTLENPTTNSARTEYIQPTTKITINEPLTPTPTETESHLTGSVSDTTTGGTGLNPPTAESYNLSLLGDKRPWGLNPFDKLPGELDFTVALGDEFDKKFNTLPDGSVKKEGVGDTPKADATQNQTDANAPKDKVKATEPKATPAEVILSDPFDPQFNQVPQKKADANPEVKPDGAKPEVEPEVKPDGGKPEGKPDLKPDGAKPEPRPEGPNPGPGENKPEGKETDGDKPPAKPGSDFFSKIVGGVTRTVTDAVDEATKLPERAAKEGSDALSSIGNALGFGTDQEAARITGNAEKGKQRADLQDQQYVKQWRGPADNGPIAPPKEGDDPAKYTVTNSDKSSYTVTAGKISDFQTAPTKDHPDGVKYSNIKYDANGQIESYSSSSLGQTHTRTSAPDANGFASWKSTDTATGKAVNFGESSTWRGKPVVDVNGFHNLIRSGTYAGQMFSRQMDGSQVATKPEYRNGHMTGLETTTTLPDNTKVSQKGHFDSKTHKLEHDPTVTVKEADGPKVSQVKFDGMKSDGVEKGSLVAPPPLEKSAAGDTMIGMFKDILSPESLNKMKDIKEMNIQRIGPHSFHVDGDVNNLFMAPPSVSVGGFGPLGRVAATPQGGFVNKFDLNMHIGDNRVDVTDVHGVHGTANLARHKRNGTVKGIGSTSTTTTGMSWDMNHNTMVARSASGPPVTLDARHFPNGGFTGNLLRSESVEQTTKQLLHGLDKNLDGASLKQVKPGVFDIGIDLKARQIPIDAKIPGVKTNLYLDDKVNFTRSSEGATFKQGEAQLGIQVGKGVEERRDIAKLSPSTNEKGEPVLKIEFHGKHKPINVPLGKPEASKAEAPKTEPSKKGDVPAAPVKRPEAEKPPVRGTDQVTPPVEPKSVEQPEVKLPKQSGSNCERDAIPRRPENNHTNQRPANNFNYNCNNGRRGLFGRRR